MMLLLKELSFGDSFIRLFTEMEPLVIGLFIIGILCCFVELFTPGFGAFGITGIVLLIAGIIIRMINGGDVYMLLFMVLFSVVIIVVMLLIVSRSMRKGWLSKSKMMDFDKDVNSDVTAATNDYRHLLGTKGTSITLLRPVGQVKFGDEIVDASADLGTIEKDIEVVCVNVEGQRVIVKIVK